MRNRLDQIYTALGTTVKMHYKIKNEMNTVVSEMKDPEDYQQIQQTNESYLTLRAFIENKPELKPYDNQLMSYLLNHIDYIGCYVESPTALSEEEAQFFKHRLIALIQDLKRILTTPQHKKIEIGHGVQALTLTGCVVEGLFGGLSKTGELIQKIVFPAFKLSIQSTDEDIEQSVTEAFDIHQYPFLLEKIKRLEERLAEQKPSIQNELTVTQATETIQPEPEIVNQQPATGSIFNFSEFAGGFFAGGFFEAVLYHLSENGSDDHLRHQL